MEKEKNPVSYPLSLAKDRGNDAASTENFFRKVRRIDALPPHDHPRTGYAVLPRDEKIRFRQIPHLHFAPGSIGRSEPRLDESGETLHEEVMVYFMGLLGVNGPLPTPFSDVILAKAKGVPHPDMEDLRSREPGSRADAGPAAFIDLFNHRFISLFYRAATSSNKAIDLDRPEESRFLSFIGSFFGLGIPSTQGRMDIEDSAALYFSGHYASPTHHAEGLCNIIADYTGATVRIDENLGHWVVVPTTGHTKLGVNRNAGTLGQTAMLGSRCWDRTMKFRLLIGPLKFADYEHFPPNSEAIKAIRSMVLLYCGREFICELNPILMKEEVPECVLGKGSRLGFSAWLKSKPPLADASDYQITVIQ